MKCASNVEWLGIRAKVVNKIAKKTIKNSSNTLKTVRISPIVQSVKPEPNVNKVDVIISRARKYNLSLFFF